MVPQDVPKILVLGTELTLENSSKAKELAKKSQFGTEQKDGTFVLSFVEGVYLADREKAILVDSKSRPLDATTFKRRVARKDKRFLVTYPVYATLRDRGYVVKTALKFGADFRVYDRGVKVGDDHSKWVVFAVHERDALTWYDFSAKNRVAHSTRKRLLICVVDDEGDVSFWESRWLRP